MAGRWCSVHNKNGSQSQFEFCVWEKPAQTKQVPFFKVSVQTLEEQHRNPEATQKVRGRAKLELRSSWLVAWG